VSTERTGPKISCLEIFICGVTLANTVGLTKLPRSKPCGCPSPPTTSSAPSSMFSTTDTATRANVAERDALAAEAKALVTLNQELQRHRASVEKSLAETRALLVRREAALEHERAESSEREQALAQTRMELEVARERLRLAPPHARPAGSRRPQARTRPKPAPRNLRSDWRSSWPRYRRSSDVRRILA